MVCRIFHSTMPPSPRASHCHSRSKPVSQSVGLNQKRSEASGEGAAHVISFPANLTTSDTDVGARVRGFCRWVEGSAIIFGILNSSRPDVFGFFDFGFVFVEPPEEALPRSLPDKSWRIFDQMSIIIAGWRRWRRRWWRAACCLLCLSL